MQAHPSAAVFPGGESMADMSGARRRRRAPLGRRGGGGARRGRRVGGRQPRRRDQGGPRRRSRHAPRRLPADRRRPGLASRSSATPPLRPFVLAHEHAPTASIWPTCGDRPHGSRPQAPAREQRRGRRRRVRARAAHRRPPALGSAACPSCYRYDPPERFVAGTVGATGARTFFLQARAGSRLTSDLAGEAAGAVLAERVDGAARRGAARPRAAPAPCPPLPRPHGGRRTARAAHRGGVPRRHDEPGLGRRDRARGHRGLPHRGGEDVPSRTSRRRGGGGREADAPEPEEILRCQPDRPAVARAFTKRAQAVVAAGRPPCPFCGSPLDPAGHLCPRANGYRRER